MKIFFAIATIFAIAVPAFGELACRKDLNEVYKRPLQDYTAILQELVDKASEQSEPVLLLKSGRFGLRASQPIMLKPGVSLKGNEDAPTVFVAIHDAAENDKEPATIQVPAAASGWFIKDIVMDDVNIDIQPHENTDTAMIQGNVFLNGGRGSVISKFGTKLLVDSNVFLRDEKHAGTEMIPKYDTTNTGILFDSQTNSIISENIFGMDLRHFDDLYPHASVGMQRPLDLAHYMLKCLNETWDNQQGYMASAVQLYMSNDITIQQNILNATFPDTKPIAQDHGISVVGSNQTYILQNFVAGWQLADFGGAVRFTSAVDSYVVSNYLANTAVMMYVANHADFLQMDNMVVYDNFLYRFLDHNVDPEPPLDGWLYEGITFFDFWTARLNYTIRPPIWNESVPISPLAHDFTISHNKFGAAGDIDPNVISMGNINPDEMAVDRANCYVTKPLRYNNDLPYMDGNTVPLLWRQKYQNNVRGLHGAKMPIRFDRSFTDDNLRSQVPQALRKLRIPEYWRAFTLRNNTVPMMDPNTPCFGGV
ncbi:hypothetical protein BC940DRAFT_316651 [Gongronella butleri]|nr:hypothetical protein BC940DRAFT_316651 [Gongronella butleri]